MGERIKKILIPIMILILVFGAVFGIYKLFSSGTIKLPKINSKEAKEQKDKNVTAGKEEADNISNKSENNTEKVAKENSDIKYTLPKNIVALEGMPIDFKKLVKIEDEKSYNVKTSKIDYNKLGNQKVTFQVGNDKKGYSKKKTLDIKIISRKEAEKGTEFLTGNGAKAKFEEGILVVDGIKIVNKKFRAPSTYNTGISEDTYNAFDRLRTAGKEAGYNVFLMYGKRSFEEQRRVFDKYVQKYGKKKALFESNPPGASPSQLGDALDINEIDINFANTDVGKWISKNASKYGFVIRYPKGQEKYTSHSFEPWFLKFVGTKTAEKLYKKGKWISLEEYYGIPAK